jgi:toxin ParE1/3/4
MVTFILAPEAQEDLLEIWAYLADSSVERANTFIDNFMKTFALIAEQPGIGRQHHKLKRFRVLVESKYLIFYRVREDYVEIARVIHGARDVEALLADM